MDLRNYDKRDIIQATIYVAKRALYIYLCKLYGHNHPNFHLQFT